MTRRGKIARLPLNIRETLNSRLENGDPGHILVLWLNSLPEVRSILAAYFKAHPITQQNLSEWKRGGFIDWQRKQVTSQRVRHLLESSHALGGAAGRQSLPDRLADILAAELAVETHDTLAREPDSAKRATQISAALDQIHKIRYTDNSYGRSQIAWERLQSFRSPPTIVDRPSKS
jgi:hypothetical protein